MKIITGRTGETHVTSDDDRHLYAGIFGTGSYILNTGDSLKATIETADTIRLHSGDIVHQGTHARIEDYEDVVMEGGTTGYKRIDLICAQYKKVGGIESVEVVVYKGQPAVSEPVAPNYTGGDILNGANLSDMPLYKVTHDGVNISEVVRIPVIATGLNTIYRQEEVYKKEEMDTRIGELEKEIEERAANCDERICDVEGGIWEELKAIEVKMDEIQNTADRAYVNSETLQNKISELETAIENINKLISAYHS